MAQFDVHRLGDTLVVDCQSDLLTQLDTRFVVPLIPRDRAPVPASRLNPLFAIGGEDHVMPPVRQRRSPPRPLAPVTSLADRAFDLIDALDVLIGGV
ncbi:MAG TPA: CcdB family protein [Sphingomicrobium sp.]|nr:CcdB family protein [Sphingomicrobium sp.]